MLRSVSATLVSNRIRERQRVDAHDAAKVSGHILVTTVVREVIDLLAVHGFVVAMEVSEPEDKMAVRARIGDLVVQRWRTASTADRQMIRKTSPALGLALDQLDVGELAEEAGDNAPA